VAAEHGAGLVCSHAGGLPPRTRPYRVEYDDVMADVLKRTLALADRAVDPSRVLIDPAHDFGKNTWHSLEVTRRLGEMVAAGWPVLVSLSHKDFIGETLNAGRGAADGNAGHHRGARVARGPASSVRTRSRRPARSWTWSAPSAVISRQPVRCADLPSLGGTRPARRRSNG
jgi:hypothetical protein